MCAQRRFWSACAFAQSDQNLHWAHFEQPRMKRFFIWTMKTDQTADMQTDLGLCWALMSEGTFSYIGVHLMRFDICCSELMWWNFDIASSCLELKISSSVVELKGKTMYISTILIITGVLQKVLSLGSDYFSAMFYQTYFYYKPSKYSLFTPAPVAQLDAPSDWRPGGRGFNPHRGRQHSFVEIDHEIFSSVILSLPLIQEGQLSVSGERMCTIQVNRLED